MFEYVLVTSVRKRRLAGDENPDIDCDQDPEYAWDVRGCYSGGSFHFRCSRVVLATGVSVPRRLGIRGEGEGLVLHSASELDRAIPELQGAQEKYLLEHGFRKRSTQAIAKQPPDPVLIVGDGLNAADAVIKCLISGVPVVHSFRKTPKDPKQILSKLSQVLYPEYHAVFQLMTGATKDSLYTVLSRTQLLSFEFEAPENARGVAVLRHLKTSSIQKIGFSRVLVLIGFEADLSFLDISDKNSDTEKCPLARDSTRPVDSKANTLNVDPFTCRCTEDGNLYAVGPLIGDNFVRYVVGGCLAAASDILRRK